MREIFWQFITHEENRFYDILKKNGNKK